MTTARLSRLQKRMLLWLLRDEQRTGGVISSSHHEMVGALSSAKGNISHSLRLLEARGWIVIGRTAGGKAEYLYLTREGRKQAVQLSGSYE
jgi:DNA-binding PadR family transcriptional regulator